MNSFFRKLDPAVDRRLLVAASGIMWTAVGVMLLKMAWGWLSPFSPDRGIWQLLTGVIMAVLIHHFGFLRLVDKNISRIREKQGKVCIFGFQPWKSYVMIIIMISLGTILRSSPLPKQYLAIIYTGMGGAMLLSSIRYHRTFLNLILKR